MFRDKTKLWSTKKHKACSLDDVFWLTSLSSCSIQQMRRIWSKVFHLIELDATALQDSEIIYS